MGDILHKRKTTTGAGSTTLTLGELALNTFDEQVYMRNQGGSGNVLVGTPHTATGVSLAAAADAAAARTTLGVDAAGTDNSTDVTIAASISDLIGISGQALTAVDAGAADALFGWDETAAKATYLTSADATATLDLFSTVATTKGLVPGSNGAAATSYLDATGNWSVPAGGGTSYVGGYNAATNTPDLDTSPSGISRGDMYTVTADGTFFTEAVEVGDLLIAEQDNPTTLAHWTTVNKNLGPVAPDINSTTTDASPDIAADFLMFYDTTEGAHNKILIQDLPLDGGTWT